MTPDCNKPTTSTKYCEMDKYKFNSENFNLNWILVQWGGLKCFSSSLFLWIRAAPNPAVLESNEGAEPLRSRCRWKVCAGLTRAAETCWRGDTGCQFEQPPPVSQHLHSVPSRPCFPPGRRARWAPGPRLSLPTHSWGFFQLRGKREANGEFVTVISAQVNLFLSLFKALSFFIEKRKIYIFNRFVSLMHQTIFMVKVQSVIYIINYLYYLALFIN